MGQQPQTAEQLFSDALELEPEARHAFLDQACRDAPDLRRLVDELLLQEERAGSFLRQPLVKPMVQPAMQQGGAGVTASMPETSRIRGSGGSEGSGSLGRSGRFEPGHTIAGRFLVVRFIARGGMGEVYEVEDHLLQGNRVALKTILPEVAANAQASHRFEQEVLLARKINHRNLCPIYEIFRCAESPPAFLFLTMKLLKGETLESRLRKSLLLPREDALEVFHQMVAGIAAIHAAGVIHRDVKPNNVMLDRSGPRLCVSIMDFGLARLNESDATAPGAGVVAGTPGYLAPELMRGHLPSQASDIFALGVLLHQVLTGERPRASADGSAVSPAASLARAPVPALYLQTVRDFLSESPVVRCRAFEQIRSATEERSLSHPGLQYAPTRWSRRRMLIASGAVCCAVAGGAVWERDRISELLHPLPLKRFVALMDWPPSSDATLKPMLVGLIDAMASELARAEAYDHNLFLIPHFSPSDVNTSAQVDEVRESLGANLILAASGRRSAKDLHVSLQVLQSPSSKALRTKQLRVPISEQLSLPQKAVRAAAELLDITHYEPDDKRAAAGTDNPEAYAAFQAAEALRKQDNDTGLEPAIEKYKEAIELDRHYALAHAKLAIAYCRLSALHSDPAALVLARDNANAALALDPGSVYAHMGRAFALQQAGDTESAIQEMTKALAVDPSNAQTLVWQAQLYADLNRWQDAEDSFRRALRLRPNYWLAHNELGAILTLQGRYAEALSEYRAASLANPRNAIALTNMACMYLQLGQTTQAIDKLRESLRVRPSAVASLTMSQALRSQGKTASALQFAKNATGLNPGNSTTWLELGDCYSMMRYRDAEAREAYIQGARAQREYQAAHPTDGPGWMLLALLEAKVGSASEARKHMRKGDSLPSADLDTQLNKSRVLELLGMRKDALELLSACFKRGATRFAVDLMPEMLSLKRDPSYQKIVGNSA